MCADGVAGAGGGRGGVFVPTDRAEGDTMGSDFF